MALTRKIAAPLIALGFATVIAPMANAATVPCEDMLKELRAKEAATSVPEAGKAAYEELKARGIERCNADDDKRADEFFAKAMELLGK